MKRPFNAIQLTPKWKTLQTPKNSLIERINNGAKVDSMEKCPPRVKYYAVLLRSAQTPAKNNSDECQWEWGLNKYENTRINSFTMFLTFVY